MNQLSAPQNDHQICERCNVDGQKMARNGCNTAICQSTYFWDTLYYSFEWYGTTYLRYLQDEFSLNFLKFFNECPLGLEASIAVCHPEVWFLNLGEFGCFHQKMNSKTVRSISLFLALNVCTYHRWCKIGVKCSG